MAQKRKGAKGAKTHIGTFRRKNIYFHILDISAAAESKPKIYGRS
jgi:hypothetical protein